MARVESEARGSDAGPPAGELGVVILFGAPGSGKGTQASALAGHLGVPVVSTGDMLRSAVAGGTDLGLRVKAVLDRGDLVDDALMAELVGARLAEADVSAGCVLDGYPRTRSQATTLDRLVGSARIRQVVLLRVPEEELARRAVARSRGADDRPEVVRERLRVFDEKTAPVAGFYRERGQLTEIDGSMTVPDVTAAILQVLDREAARV